MGRGKTCEIWASDYSSMPEEREDVAYINRLFRETCPLLTCLLDPYKGRTIRVTSNVQPGQILYAGGYLNAVCEAPTNPVFSKLVDLKAKLQFEPIWYWCALNSFTKADALESADLATISSEAQQQFLMLYRPDKIEPSESVALLAQHLFLSDDQALKLEHLLQTWKYNCFEHSDDPLGFSAYFLPSFLSHSCAPNAIWFESPAEGFVVRARRSIQAGDEITISYIPENHLCRDSSERRKFLESTKNFKCECERCTEGYDEGDEGVVECRSLLDDIERENRNLITRKEFEILNRGIRKLDPHHWMRAECYSLFVDYELARKDVEAAEDFAERRVRIFEKILGKEAVNAAFAWAREELADVRAGRLLRSHDHGTNLHEDKVALVIKLYEQAARDLELMFGSRNEYVVGIRDKISKLM